MGSISTQLAVLELVQYYTISTQLTKTDLLQNHF